MSSFDGIKEAISNEIGAARPQGWAANSDWFESLGDLLGHLGTVIGQRAQTMQENGSHYHHDVTAAMDELAHGVTSLADSAGSVFREHMANHSETWAD